MEINAKQRLSAADDDKKLVKAKIKAFTKALDAGEAELEKIGDKLAEAAKYGTYSVTSNFEDDATMADFKKGQEKASIIIRDYEKLAARLAKAISSMRAACVA